MRFRAPTPQDAEAVLAVLVARDMADLGAPDHMLGDVHDEWGASTMNLADDALVAETDDGRIVGYAAVAHPGIQAVVVPDREGQGIGKLLLAWAEERDRKRGRARHCQWLASTNQRGRALLLDAGYEPSRSYWRLVRPLHDCADPGGPPAGIRLRRLDLDRDPKAVYDLNEASFAANPDYRPESFQTFCEEHLHATDLDAALSLVAESNAIPVGFLLTERWQEHIGFVDLLGVHPDFRRRGLATAMLTAAFAQFAAAGLSEAHLGVASDNPNALRLYERCGMRQRYRFDTYERDGGSSRAAAAPSH